MKKTILILLSIVIAIGAYITYQEFNNPGFSLSGNSGVTVLAGTPTRFDRMPVAFVEDSTTTTDPALDEGGRVFSQQIYTAEADVVNLTIQAKGGTATSSVFIWPFVSDDGLTFYRPTFTTSTDNTLATTTVSGIPAIVWDPSTTTSTVAFSWPTKGWQYFRFVMYGEDIADDPTDFVKAYIKASAEPVKIKSSSL